MRRAWSTGNPKGYALKPYDHRAAHSLPRSQDNILIDHNGHACLYDFSLVTIAAGRSTDTSSLVEGGTIRWMSPERIDPEVLGLKDGRPTKASDCYALGMVVYEVLSGRAPFTPRTAPLVIFKILAGGRPGRPEGEGGALFTDDIWGMLELCWKHQPDERISAKAVLLCLEGTPPLSLPSSDVDGVAESDTDEQFDVALSNSSMFFLFTEGIRLTFSHPHGATGPPTTRSDNGLQVPPNGYPLGMTSPTVVPPDGGELPAPPQQGGSEGGWIRRLVRKAREKFKAIA